LGSEFSTKCGLRALILGQERPAPTAILFIPASCPSKEPL
jgi:hypothetical protein